MARVIEIVATTSGNHYILCGVNNSEISSFSWQLYITHFGARAVDWLTSLSLGFVAFMGGDVWLANSNNVPRNSFFGEQKYSEVGVVANQEPNLVKLLDSIGIHSDGKWSVESITIPKDLNHPNGMFSRLPKERFKKRDGIWQAEFLRNMRTTDGVSRVKDAISGETLRGQSAYLVLKNTDTSQVKLYKIDFNMSANRG